MNFQRAVAHTVTSDELDGPILADGMNNRPPFTNLPKTFLQNLTYTTVSW